MTRPQSSSALVPAEAAVIRTVAYRQHSATSHEIVLESEGVRYTGRGETASDARNAAEAQLRPAAPSPNSSVAESAAPGPPARARRRVGHGRALTPHAAVLP